MMQSGSFSQCAPPLSSKMLCKYWILGAPACTSHSCVNQVLLCQMDVFAQHIHSHQFVLAEGLWGKDQKLKAEFKELIKGEWEVSQAIMRGHAIAEHMEDKYHDILKVS